MKISKKIKTDKRSKISVEVKVHKTKIYLRIGDTIVKLKRTTAERIHRTLGRALMIQDSRKSMIE